MLEPGTLLQNRYRVLRQIGGGGMGVVYLAEDTRLPGRRCAIKEMSPAQLAPGDRQWAVQAFQQEAQILARLSHPGLTAVTDFFPEGDNWYLVMDYVEGETLKERLERAPGGRLPLDEALNIVGQLCRVLEYLHGQNPPVVFRDLKPGNVMLTPRGEVKLIDFGIARFFKPGQTRDTINLGTPGYAAPEQYGGLGQSDPRADVYSLGVLLHQMVTGYDPTTAATPFPLPPPGSLGRGLPPNVERVISRAVQLQPHLRYSSVGELRQELFPPTAALPPRQPPSAAPPRPAPAPRSNRGLWVGLGVAGGALLLLCVAVLVVAWLAGGLPGWGRGLPPSTPVPTAAVAASQSPAAPSPAPTSVTASPSGAAPVGLEWTTIGRSVQGRALSVAGIGHEGGIAVVVVGSIQGDQTNTRDLVNALVAEFEHAPQQVPEGVALYLLPSINPDGNAANSRFNANGVDLNRNWDTTDWRSDAAVPGYPEGKPGAGGDRPFSEPETRALRDFLLQVRSRSQSLRVIVLHSSVRRSQGEVYPAGEASVPLADTYARVAGYDVEMSWAEYTTSGELVTWCDEEGLLSIDVVIPGSQTPSTRVPGTGRTLLELTLEAVLEVAAYRQAP